MSNPFPPGEENITWVYGSEGQKQRLLKINYAAAEVSPQTTTKQVIVIRRDLGMRRGKEIAQGSHASLAFLTRRLNKLHGTLFSADLTPAQVEWLQSSFAKVVCQVPDLEALEAVIAKAAEAGVEYHRVTDAGRTEIPAGTVTAVAVGPDYSEKIDEITGDLALY